METASALTTEQSAPVLALSPFRALRLANSYVGDPVANRIFARPYRSVPDRLRESRRKRHLVRDPDPAFYIHEYTSSGVTVRGLVANLELGPSEARVLPHEDVQPAQVDQLADRMVEMSLNPAPILLVHRGPAQVRSVIAEQVRREPDLVYTDRADQLQRIWRLTDPSVLDVLATSMAASTTFIADGHHRYAAAQRLRERAPGTGWERTLAMVIDHDDTPLQLCAIHRTVPRVSLDLVASTADTVGGVFRRHDTSHSALAKLGRSLVLHDGRDWATLTPADADRLLVCWLHEDVLDAWQVPSSRVAFHHSATAALERAGSDVAVLLPAPSFDKVSASAMSGHLLPEKATSFQPKPHLGVIMREVRQG
ncbi:DUF1015 family protein [Nocardioides sp. AE5]|uniref:DUF1015 family protein n=1 Tax=Nocardioides sp. AE5 TaxID=2962573 RepID=UPI0028817767|nr:DUF1015 family protein [Nocardioides sp. AE5]MDT0201543.1 DUF1015 family protein [Nocardioides sp. AE5]